MNSVFFSGFSPGSSRLRPVSVDIDQLLCLPEPFMPSKGFSCNRQMSPCFWATFFISSMVSMFLSMATLVLSNTGAISCWAGATSLCLVLEGMPNDHSVSSRSAMNSAIVGLMVPK